MKKNIMKDTADDVKEVLISKTNDGVFLVAKEDVYQAVSKSDKGGFRQISGYNEERVSSYDLNTGALSNRVGFGENREYNISLLGETDGKIWLKSIDKKLGFHARDPKTLDIIISEEKIINENPFLKDNLSQPDWVSIQRYYGFDILKKMPLVTDNSGFVYYIDPVSLKAEKTSESIENSVYDNRCLSTSIKLDINTSIYLNGSPRNFIVYFGKNINEPSFLKGEFMKSSVNKNPSEMNAAYFEPYVKEVEKYNREIDSLKKIVAGYEKDSAAAAGDLNKKILIKHSYQNAVRNIGYLQDRIKYANDNLKRYSNDDLSEIVTKDNSVFILSQSDVTDKAKVVISKTGLNRDTTATLHWQTELNDIFRDPERGMDESSFDFVFSKGNPVLRTMKVLQFEDKLVFIFMLKAVCLDVKSGNILWSVNL